MSKVVGKDLELWFDGVEVPVISANLSEAFDTLDSTDTATPSDGKDFEINRAARSFTAEAILYAPLGAEISTGTLEAGKRYQVTAKDTVLAAYEIGQIFEAVGTETMSSTDKVKPLSAKLTGKTMAFNFNSADVPLVSADISIKYDQLDVTDTATTGDGSETIVSRADRESKISGIVRSEVADLLTTNPIQEAATLTFNTGQTVVGKIIPVSKSIADEAAGFAKVDYSFKWYGKPVETAVGLAPAVEKAFKLILKRGATTHKQYSGNAIITEKTISSDIKGLTKVSYTFYINGAVTYAVAN